MSSFRTQASILQTRGRGQYILILLLTMGILFGACPAYCTDYYVSPDGNDSDDGSIDHPFQTIGKAVDVVVAGGTIYVRGGTYTYTGSSTAITLPSKSGSSETNRCSLMGYNGERPLVDFSSMTGTSADGLKINGSYWYVKGIDFKGAPHNGIKISGGSYNIIEFCSSYENRNTGIQLASGAANNQIINCDSYYNYDAPAGGNADGFAPKMDVGTGNYFYGCRSWQNSDDAYDGYLRGADDVTTTYENCWAFKAGYLKDGSICTGGNGNGFKMGGSDTPRLLRHNVILKNCLAFSNSQKGFDQNHNRGSMTLYNCTAYNNGADNYYIVEADPLASGKTATITNGVYFTGSISLASFVVQTTNSWLSPFVVTSADFVSIDPAAAYGPRNADGSLPDITFMHLAAGSDLIDGGTDVGLPYNGSAPDLGCFETVGTSLPGQASSPVPSSGATDVSLTQDLSWTAGSGATSHDVYFGTTSPGTFQGNQADTSFDTGTMAQGVTYYWRIDEKNASGTTTGTVWSFTTASAPDTTPPTPDPMTWVTVPTATGSNSITMTATTATDATPPVQYYFECTNHGEANSTWQTSTTYTPTGLTPNTQYSFRVKARDSAPAQNQTGWSSTQSATTWPPDTTPPNPNPMTWASAPAATGPYSITMTATTATDTESPPVQYYFECTNHGEANSTWQTSATYAPAGLTPSTLYTFRVKARDSAPAQNETGWSTAESATTEAPPTDVEIIGSWVTGLTHANEPGTNRVLIFIAHCELNAAISLSGVTYGGQSMTKVIDIVTGTSGYRNYVAAFILDEAGIAATTSGTFVPSWSATPTTVSYASVFLQNVDQTDIIGATDSAVVTTGTTVATGPLDTNDGDMVILGAVSGNNGSYTLNNGFNEGTDQSVGSSGHTGVTGHKAATGVAETPSATHSTSYRQAIIGLVVQAGAVTPPPGQASSPTPATGATNVSLTQDLSWTAGSGATSRDVYFGTVNPPVTKVIADGTALTYDTGTMASITTYYWRIDEKNAGGTTTGTVWSFTTLDATPPVPNPMTWAIEPNAISSSSIDMTATTATDISGVGYYFANVTDPNHDSNWVASPAWTDTGLDNNTTYTYQVKARDLSASHNETGWSGTANATTLSWDCNTPIASDIDGDCEVDFFDFANLADAWAGNPPPVDLNGDSVLDFKDIVQFANDWLTCNRNPAEECWQ